MWISEAGFPQRLMLRWSCPVPVRKVELTLDTGLHRELRLSMSEAVAKRSIRGPQPETISDFAVRLYQGDRLVAERAAFGNYQRKVRLDFQETFECTHLEFEARKAWGVDCARLFEVRVYDEQHAT